MLDDKRQFLVAFANEPKLAKLAEMPLVSAKNIIQKRRVYADIFADDQ